MVNSYSKRDMYHVDHLFNMIQHLKKRIENEPIPNRKNRMQQDLGSLQYAYNLIKETEQYANSKKES